MTASKDADSVAGFFAMNGLCARFCWIIIGPIMMTSLAKMKEATESNIDSSLKFEAINRCADEY